MAENKIFVYSVVAALMSGLSSPGTSLTATSLLQHGTHGLGTFAHMDGEMIILDGTIYQLRADGSISESPSDALIPFAQVAHFKAQHSKRTDLHAMRDIDSVVTELLPNARNIFVAVRCTGTFRYVKVRAIHAQAYAGQPLTELGRDQSVFEHRDVRGTIIGFRSPRWSDGLSVPGLHIHFVDEGRTCGGHVLAVETEGEAEVQVALCSRVELQLPESEEFGSRNLEQDAEGLAKVEGG